MARPRSAYKQVFVQSSVLIRAVPARGHAIGCDRRGAVLPSNKVDRPPRYCVRTGTQPISAKLTGWEFVPSANQQLIADKREPQGGGFRLYSGGARQGMKVRCNVCWHRTLFGSSSIISFSNRRATGGFGSSCACKLRICYGTMT